MVSLASVAGVYESSVEHHEGRVSVAFVAAGAIAAPAIVGVVPVAHLHQKLIGLRNCYEKGRAL